METIYTTGFLFDGPEAELFAHIVKVSWAQVVIVGRFPECSLTSMANVGKKNSMTVLFPCSAVSIEVADP